MYADQKKCFSINFYRGVYQFLSLKNIRIELGSFGFRSVPVSQFEEHMNRVGDHLVQQILV